MAASSSRTFRLEEEEELRVEVDCGKADKATNISIDGCCLRLK